MKTLIVTADDFGLDLAVNEAVERAHRDGILTCASLMVGAPAAADAVARAKQMPRLGVGLHLTLVDGAPSLPPERVASLVGRDGRFARDPVHQGVRIYCSPRARRELREEICAQLAAFRATGLALDHVNGHHHFHVHPTIRRTLVGLAAEHGIRAVRVPLERRANAPRSLLARSAANQAERLRRNLQAAGIAANDAIFGVESSGHMTKDRVRTALAEVPEGVSELYFHPTARPWRAGDSWPAGYDGEGELAALVDPQVRADVARHGIRLATFGEAWRPP